MPIKIDPSNFLFEEIDQYASPEEIKEVGCVLFKALFSGEVGRAFERSRQFGDLRLQVNIRPLELSLLPWELCFDQTEQKFICLRKGDTFVRILDSIRGSNKLVLPENLRILHVYSNPADLEPLNISKDSLGRQGIVTDLGDATTSKLRIALSSGQYDVLHIDGHGLFDEDEEVGVIFLQDDKGNSKAISASTLGDYLADTEIKLVVLSACETARDGSGKRFAGVASHLMRSCSIPAIVAFQTPISDSSAILFNTEFYRGLRLGMRVEDAVVFARWAVKEENLFEAFSPILLMR